MNKLLLKIVAILGFVALFLLAYNMSFAGQNNQSFGNEVKSNNENNQGYIFVSTGENQGSQQIGSWTDSSFLKGDKGDKGDMGLQGIQGVQGISGQNGFDGLNGIDGKNGDNGLKGIDGYTPVKNIDYFDGLNGKEGLNGKDVDSILVKELQNTDTNLSNKVTNTNNRIDNLDNRVSKLEKTQFNVRTELKFVREKHLEIGVYSVYSTTRNTCSEVGINIVIPIGESYQDRENKRINARLDRLEQKIEATTVITRTVEKGKIKSIEISDKLSINGEF